MQAFDDRFVIDKYRMAANGERRVNERRQPQQQVSPRSVVALARG